MHVDIDTAVYYDASGRSLGNYAVGEVELAQARAGATSESALSDVLACAYCVVDLLSSWDHPLFPAVLNIKPGTPPLGKILQYIYMYLPAHWRALRDCGLLERKLGPSALVQFQR